MREDTQSTSSVVLHEAELKNKLPIGATFDSALLEQISTLADQLPDSMSELYKVLSDIDMLVEFDAARVFVVRLVLARLRVLTHAEEKQRLALLDMARDYMTTDECVPVCRRFAKDPSAHVRGRVKTLIRTKKPKDVALPLEEGERWDASGWSKGINVDPEHETSPLFKHERGSRIQRKHGVPEIATVKELRALLKIKSEKQLGYLLLSNELEDGSGPYTLFEIPKKDKSPRLICAPRQPLKGIQRRILDRILSDVPPHETAHGFVPGRSIVTNAAVHQSKEIVIKFDLENFFPSMHYYRVMGLFAQLGYDVGEGFFQSDDESEAIAPVLARLTTYTSNPKEWGRGYLPQGAPTSPYIANLICRGLDARLSGLARSLDGDYTRYADDMTFSFAELPRTKIGRFRWWVDQICQQEGFAVNQKKFRVVRRSQRQMVTGIVVNDTLRVPRKERRRFRAILHNCERYGLESQARGRKDFPAYLQGYASYINMVHPDEGRKFIEQVEHLLQLDREGKLPIEKDPENG